MLTNLYILLILVKSNQIRLFSSKNQFYLCIFPLEYINKLVNDNPILNTDYNLIISGN